jgi:hypothetical protein
MVRAVRWALEVVWSIQSGSAWVGGGLVAGGQDADHGQVPHVASPADLVGGINQGQDGGEDPGGAGGALRGGVGQPVAQGDEPVEVVDRHGETVDEHKGLPSGGGAGYGRQARAAFCWARVWASR